MNTISNAISPRSLRHILFAAFTGLLMAFAGTAQAQFTPQSGYWVDPAEQGNGFVIEIQGNQMFMAAFLYANSGEATWVASVGAMSSATQYSGPLITYTGGQTLTGNYVAPALSTQNLGNVSITFTSATQANMTWPAGSIQIQRFDIVAGGSSATASPVAPQTGWWFNAAESGRGFAVEVQENTMFLAGYMYDANGNPVWYVSGPTALTNSGLYQGTWVQFEGGLTLTSGYKFPTTANADVGSVTIQFSSTTNATMTLPGGRQIPFSRFNFNPGSDPTLSSFSTTSATPTTLLTINGTNINPAATLSLTFADSSGFSANIPPTAATSTSVSVAVPPYFLNGAFGSGTVGVTLNQNSGGSSASSNTLPGFTIQKLPSTSSGGNATLALIQGNLQAAQKLQTKIKGTAQDTPAVEAQIQTQITDLQTLVGAVQSVVGTTASLSLGDVGGVNINVTQSNIGGADALIQASLQSLTAQITGGSEKAAQQNSAQACMAAEASAFQAAIANNESASALAALAESLLEAPNASPACATVDAFALAFDIFAGAGNIGLGITDAAGLQAELSELPSAALFTTMYSNTNVAVSLNALLSAELAAEATAVQAVVSDLSGLNQAATNELIAEATGIILATEVDALAFINLVAPLTSNSVPDNLPVGDYTVSYTYSVSGPGVNSSGSGGPIAQTGVGGQAFATLLQNDVITYINALCSEQGFTCGSTYSVTPFNGTSFQISWSFAANGYSFSIVYSITKTG